MQIPIISGRYVEGKTGHLRTAYPLNLVPILQETGVSDGYLCPAEGLVEEAQGPGVCRGGIVWNEQCYRIMGSRLVRVNANSTVDDLGDVGIGGPVRMDYSFDRLAIASGGSLYYWNGSTLTKVTDPDLGVVVDMLWVDGYFMTTDGQYLVVTDLNDPTQINPLKYGSAERDPDPIVAVLKILGEVYALNRYSVEVFQNAGTSNFPFQRAQQVYLTKGCVGTHTCCVLENTLFFLGGGRNEPVALYAGSGGKVEKVSTQEVDQMLATYTPDQLKNVVVEPRKHYSHQFLYIHLPDRCLVYDVHQAASSNPFADSKALPGFWFVLSSGLTGFNAYRGRHMVYAYGQWLVADTQSGKLGRMAANTSTHWGEPVRWEFSTEIVYNKGQGAIFHELELVALTGGGGTPGQEAKISTSYSTDGMTWAQEKTISAGGFGQTNKRLVWYRQGHMRHWRVQRFNGTSDAHLSFLNLQANLEPLGL